MQNTLTIAGIQTALFWENPTANLNHFGNLIDNLNENVELVILPEMFNTGFTMQPINVAESMQGETVFWMQEKAVSNTVAIVGSIAIKENNNYYNRLLFIHPNGKIETYNKKHLFTLAGENIPYKSGTKKLIVSYKGWKICPFICYDLRFPVWNRNIENYDVLIYVANWPSARIHAWNILLQARAIENMSYAIGVNRTGKDMHQHEYPGHSGVYDFLGEKMYKTIPNVEDVFIVTLNKTRQEKAREKLNFLNDKETFTMLQ
ncbi:MAG: nitrilase family protein [Flavobacteriaceae bacterium]|nr:MAG: nitrilase family protein [Flavobacteriaceae bacterium]